MLPTFILTLLVSLATPILALPLAQPQSPNGIPGQFKESAPQFVAPASADSNYTSASVPFFACPSTTPAGTVNNITIAPCERDEEDEPCRFEFGTNYTITIDYTSYLGADAPRSSLEARDDDELPSLRYPYSGQSFGGCEYTNCPVVAGQPSTYTYNFVTLESPFDYLTFNLSQTLDGPSLFCAGFQALYFNSNSTVAN